MLACPRCGSTELRAHGPRVQITWVRRWGFFGRMIPRSRTVAVDCTCANATCLHAFISRETGITEAPMQTGQVLRNSLVSGSSGSTGAKDGQPAPPPERPVALPLAPSPARDPRVKRR